MPLTILYGVIFAPITIALIVATCLTANIITLVVAICLTIIFAILIVIFFVISNKKQYYLTVMDNFVKIVYPNVGTNLDELILKKEDIQKIEYFKLSSLHGWLNVLLDFTLPTATNITYKTHNGAKTDFIGYLDYNDIITICRTLGTNLVVHKFIKKQKLYYN